MKWIMITAPNSSSGKTIITTALIRGLLNKGFNVCSFKTGLIYTFKTQRWYKKAISMGEAEYCIIEGVIGRFDGIYK